MKLLLFFFPLLLAAPAPAQETRTVQIRVICFDRGPAGLKKLAVASAEGAPLEIRFPTSFPSEKAAVPVIENLLTFYNPENPAGPPAAIARIPANLKNALVLFFPAPQPEAPNAPEAPETHPAPLYRAEVIDASPKGIPEDGALLLNLFSADVRIVLGEHRIQLKPGKQTGLKRPASRNPYNMAALVFQVQDGTEWNTAAETMVHFPTGQQKFFVAYPDARSGRLALRSYKIDDY